MLVVIAVRAVGGSGIVDFLRVISLLQLLNSKPLIAVTSNLYVTGYVNPVTVKEVALVNPSDYQSSLILSH
jgi:hypothetical protein